VEKKGRVVVGMSGGVDSTVAAYLLRESGWEVIGVTLRLWSGCEARAEAHRRPCCSLSDLREAGLWARRLGLEHLAVDVRREFVQCVVNPFVREYVRGRTPNPCVECNRRLKFPQLLRAAERLGATRVATGHYARVEERAGAYRLMRGKDRAKDQSYVLWRLGQEWLSRLLLPLGGLLKSEVCRMAGEMGLETAERQESQDICFLPGRDYREFIEETEPGAFRPGLIVDTEGRVLGRHRGIAGFTVGQRRGLGIAAHRPLYVIDLDPDRDLVVVGGREEAEMRRVEAEEAGWVAGTPPVPCGGSFPATVKVRYQMEAVPGTVTLSGRDSFAVELEEPVPAAAPGQSAVLYRGEELLGGGIIVRGKGADLPRVDHVSR
jgi:tRNA-specific 2-thiouridylase